MYDVIMVPTADWRGVMPMAVWRSPPTPIVRMFTDKSLHERQGQQRARDGTVRIRQKRIEGVQK